MKVAYLVNTYPRPSHTFIRREIAALERAGWQITRFAMRSVRAELVDPADLAEDDRTTHLLARGLLRAALGGLSLALRRPGPALRALSLALASGAQGSGGAAGAGGRLRNIAYWLEAAEVARRCRQGGIRHIHAHFGTNPATVAMLAAEIGGLGFSFTVHGPEEFDAPHAHGLGRKIARAAFVVAISSFGRAQLFRWADPADWPRIHVIRCGIEPWRFPAPAPPAVGPPHLVAIGRLSEQKGLGLLIEAMALAAPRIPGISLAILGEGPFRATIEADIARAGLGAQIRLAGWQDEAGVHAELARAHALILPSFAEGLPMVIMEAFAAGRPAIATAIAGVPELVGPETGWLVPAGDAEALAEAITALAATPHEALARMGRAAREAVMARHDIDAEAARLAALFRAALDGDTLPARRERSAREG